MKQFKHSRPFILAWAMGMIPFVFSTACDRSEMSSTAPAALGHEDSTETDTNRIDIPPSVRQNLGITFVTVEKRPVRSTVRLPGQFEFRPEARREYHVMLSGRIELLVKQYERVERGQPLFHLDSPEWRRMQSDLVGTLNTMKRSHADVAVAEAKNPALGPKHSDVPTDAVDYVDRVGHGVVVEKGDAIIEVDSQQPRQCGQNSGDHADFATHIPPRECTGIIRRGRFAALRAALSL